MRIVRVVPESGAVHVARSTRRSYGAVDANRSGARARSRAAPARACAARARLARRTARARAPVPGGPDVRGRRDRRERELQEFLAERAPRVAFYSEDRGLVAEPDATDVLVVDPIDGTRPAMAGLESACVAVALAPLGDGEPTMADVEIGCVVEIKTGDWYLAVRGRGSGRRRAVSLSANAEIARHVLGIRLPRSSGRPTVEVLGDLIDALIGRRRHLRARLAGVRDDQDRDRPARRRDRGRLAADR